MSLHLFAGFPVTDYAKSLAWYEKLLGASPSFFPNDVEAVWILAEDRSVYIIVEPKRAGGAINTVIVDDLDAHLAAAAEHGIEPVEIEEYDNGVRKAIYLDPDGNEIGFGGLPT